MFDFLKKTAEKKKFDRNILYKNSISLLILDERWNGLFKNIEKTPDIISLEEKLKELLKTQSRLIAESKETAVRKKKCMERIIQLTPEVFDKKTEEARNEMRDCENEINKANKRTAEIEAELGIIPSQLEEINIELLEKVVYLVYFKIRSNQLRVKELEGLIEDTRQKLKEYIEEKETLSEDDTDIYSYFHDLLGPEELEKLDKEFFG
jgi:chromosome segregation ATPase